MPSVTLNVSWPQMRAVASPPAPTLTRTTLFAGTQMRYRSRGSSLTSSRPETRADCFAAVVSEGLPSWKSRPGATSSTSSFGSLGSFGGADAVSAVGMSSRPYPAALSKPGAPMSRALVRITSKICVTSRSGRAVQTHAAAAETIGAAKLVPSRPFRYPVELRDVGTAPTMCVPGATRSSVGDVVENDTTSSRSFVAPTLSTCGYAEGYVGGLPCSPELPEAATTRQPWWNAVRIACSISGSRRLLPQLRLITPGQCCAAARMPEAATGSRMTNVGLASHAWSTACG